MKLEKNALKKIFFAAMIAMLAVVAQFVAISALPGNVNEKDKNIEAIEPDITYTQIHPSMDHIKEMFSKPENKTLDKVISECEKFDSFGDKKRCFNIVTYVNQNDTTFVQQVCTQLDERFCNDFPEETKQICIDDTQARLFDCSLGIGRYTW